ncbi:unnamed protein product [Ixodes hexagonus]
MKKSPKFAATGRRGSPPMPLRRSSSSTDSKNEEVPAAPTPEPTPGPQAPPYPGLGLTNLAFSPGDDVRGTMGSALPPPLPVQPYPPPSPSRVSVSEARAPEAYPEPPARGGGERGVIRFRINRGYYRSLPGVMGVIEVVGATSVITTLSLRGFIFDIFFFLCNLGFTYAFIGLIFFLNGLLQPETGPSSRSDVPLMVSVLYYGLGFIMFLAGGIAALVKSQRDFVAITAGVGAVIVAITLFLHTIYSVRNA